MEDKEIDQREFAKILPPRETAPKSAVLVLKDVLLNRNVFWNLTGTTVFGFAWGKDVHAVIPWEELGLSLETKLGKFGILDSELSRLRAEEGEEDPNMFGPTKPVVLDIQKHKFVLGYVKEEDAWCFAAAEDSLLRIEHLPFGDKKYHPCGSRLKGAECPNFCGLKHGDYVKIGYRIHPSDGHKREELAFAFYDHEEEYDEPEGLTLLMMPDTVLPKILSSLTPKEYLNGVGLTAPEINATLQEKMPWKMLELRYTLDGLRTAKVASAAALTAITCKVAPPTGICSAAPDPEEFVEKFHRLLIGTNLASLYVWDTRLLRNAPTPPKLKNLNLCLYRGEGTFKERLGCLEKAPIERVQMSAVEGLRGREFFDMLPTATKLHLGVSKQKHFWSTSTKAQVATVTHLCIELRGCWSNVKWECPILLMHNLENLCIKDMKALFPNDLWLGFHERLKTMSLCILMFVDSSQITNLWSRISSAAPNLENFWMSGEMQDWAISSFCQGLKSLKRLVLLGTEVSLNGVRDILKDLSSLEYLRVETKSFRSNSELRREDFLAHAAADCALGWTFVPRADGTGVFDVKFFYSKLAQNEVKQAEQIFKF